MEYVLVIGVLAAAAKVVTLHKIGAWDKLLGLDWGLDLLAGNLFAFLFFGTLTGMAVAMVASLSFSLYLLVYKKVRGYRRYSFMRQRWETVPPAWFHR